MPRTNELPVQLPIRERFPMTKLSKGLDLALLSITLKPYQEVGSPTKKPWLIKSSRKDQR